ncbi:hypothetical protein M8994_23330, partial [Brucella sp. 21LCYQ03]|nr:hypothetical protein [Brucella sp. 21LCYQ03]
MLYDASTGQNDRYRFRPNNNYAIGTLATEFWNKSATTPTGAYSSTVDPCTLVYPNNVWFTPTEANRNALGTPTRTVRNVVDGNARFTAQWDQAASVAANPAYPDNSLILLYLG